MSSLPPDPITLHGGCYCNAIKYTISVPALADRPIAVPASTTNPPGHPATDIRAPAILLDHCDRCRRVSGAFLMAWFVCPQAWVTWSLRLLTPSKKESSQEGAQGGEEEEHRITLPSASVVGPPSPATHGTTVAHLSTTPGVHRIFCSACGTNLTYARVPGRDPKNPTVDLTVGSFAREFLETGVVRVEREVWWGSGVAWVQELVRGAGLPRHERGSMATVMGEDECDK